MTTKKLPEVLKSVVKILSTQDGERKIGMAEDQWGQECAPLSVSARLLSLRGTILRSCYNIAEDGDHLALYYGSVDAIHRYSVSRGFESIDQMNGSLSKTASIQLIVDMLEETKNADC